jgi:hypothetical protein
LVRASATPPPLLERGRDRSGPAGIGFEGAGRGDNVASQTDAGLAALLASDRETGHGDDSDEARSSRPEDWIFHLD